ncbi:hypothetical protein EWM64_g9350 [Hericium alpestre]|uniref:Uncharacterized protein n=1 Tax=Hericium alpestre TaxID=135208 RepID=A0A4Y9ZJN9_9AGAM|nr:hypothetical protein EWM64_g9350 [Hericium alpestre]
MVTGLISLVFAVITIKCVLFGHGLEASILVIPVATLFAFTSLRAAMPGAPSGFGERDSASTVSSADLASLRTSGAIVDFVGTLPSLAFLAVESFLCLMHLIIRPTEKDPDKAGQSVKPRLEA